MAKKQTQSIQFFLCITDSEPDLEIGKFYRVLPDPSAAKSECLRVVDESGEDYVYPASFFTKMKLPDHVREALLKAS